MFASEAAERAAQANGIMQIALRSVSVAPYLDPSPKIARTVEIRRPFFRKEPGQLIRRPTII